jgi:Na+-transporting NADH:ubiquinone oxidoreductase subunit E
MMENLVSLFVNSVFVGNILLAYFLGMCSYLSVSKNLQTSLGLGLAVTFVMTITTPANWFLYHRLLAPGALAWAGLPDVDLSYLKLVLFIATIAGMSRWWKWSSTATPRPCTMPWASFCL